MLQLLGGLLSIDELTVLPPRSRWMAEDAEEKAPAPRVVVIVEKKRMRARCR